MSGAAMSAERSLAKSQSAFVRFPYGLAMTRGGYCHLFNKFWLEQNYTQTASNETTSKQGRKVCWISPFIILSYLLLHLSLGHDDVEYFVVGIEFFSLPQKIVPNYLPVFDQMHWNLYFHILRRLWLLKKATSLWKTSTKVKYFSKLWG